MAIPLTHHAPHSRRWVGRTGTSFLKWSTNSSSERCRALSAAAAPPRSRRRIGSSAETSTHWPSLQLQRPVDASLCSNGTQRRYNHGDSAEERNNRVTKTPPKMTISRASNLYRTHRLAPSQLVQHCRNLALFGEQYLYLNAYAKILPLDQILEQARLSDERWQEGNPKSLLDGIPVTVKANIAVGKYWEMPNACSAILTRASDTGIATPSAREEEESGVYESDIAKRLLQDCGAVIIGITNMDEFGMGSLGTNNGLQNHRYRHGETSQSEQHFFAQKENYSPTYNPLPWMQRLSLLLDDQKDQSGEEEEDYLLQQIHHSTPANPHGINDEAALDIFLTEVQCWVHRDIDIIDSSSTAHSTSPLLSPGGSSSGAAASACHGSSLLSIGTDTGGSIRLPSAWTSTIGFKPSYGTWSRYGVVSYASSLDTVGFIAGTAECAEIAWRCLKDGGNRDDGDGDVRWNELLGRDSTARVYHNAGTITGAEQNSAATNINGAEQSAAATNKPLEYVRVGIPSAFSLQNMPPLVSRAWSDSANHLQNVGGATLVSVPESKLSSHWIKLALASYYVLACAEASSNLSRYDGVRYGMDFQLDWDEDAELDALHGEDFPSLLGMTALERQISATRAHGFGEETQRRVLAGTSVLSSDRFHTHYEAAAVARANLSRSLDAVFPSTRGEDADENDGVDVMLVPTALSFPSTLKPLCGDGTMDEVDPTEAFANDVMTIPISLGGLPSISVPFRANVCSVDGTAETNPIGMQIFSSRGSEDLVLMVGNNLP